jgi:hypothetical protein
MKTDEENKRESNCLSKSNIEDQAKDDITKRKGIKSPKKIQSKSTKMESIEK